ncbi:RHS repeat-associated core domain-containing protein [Desulfovibrio sp. JC010]|uniref:RHS repeat-associated core domain-containing protein n=1 Tax=Desulfovibrio sp. JC010 TaxID=2593641 RepID=UPI0013D5DD25|nr:RHS repeat-associated core domain-containing protein [Desulfovibrio sp. JC010]NDV25602.1 hypothetical protein [Desulfovibrio sp. JC010]
MSQLKDISADFSVSTMSRYGMTVNPHLSNRKKKADLSPLIQVGTIYIVANGEGNEVKRIIRDSFGNVIVDTNKQMDIPLGFAAGLHDKDTGLVHFGYREYDPTIGRFIQPDPLGLAGGDVDVYGYCADDPVNFIDRVGLFDVSGSGHAGEHGKSDTLGGGSGGALDGLLGQGKGVLSGMLGGEGSGAGGASNGARNGGQNARNNANYEQGSKQATTDLNQSGARKGQAVADATAELADKQAKYGAKEQAKRDRAAAADKRNSQRRAAIEATNGWSSPFTDTVDPNGQAKPNTTQDDPAKTSAQHAREMEKTYKEVAKKQRADEKARKDNIARAGSELREARLRGDVRANKGKKNKNGLSLMELGTSGLKGAAKGAPIGATWGSTFGPAGTLAGFWTGAIVGAPVNMLYDVGGIAISDIFGPDKDSQGRLRDAMEKSNTKSKRR